MTINDIVNAWECNELPQSIEMLSAWKLIIDRAESDAFEAWRTSNQRSEGEKLINDHLKYQIISIALKQKISELMYQKSAKQRGSLF